MRRDSPASGRCPLFTEDHEAFRKLAREFVEKEIGPHYADWEKAGHMPRETYEKLGALGMMGMAIPEEYGGQVKLFCTEMQGRVVDRCLQLFGGYGYMMEYPIARLYADAGVARIYAGTSEVMKVIIAKSLGL